VFVDPPPFIMRPLLLFVLGTLRFIMPLPLFVPLTEVLALEQPVAASASAASDIALMVRFWRIALPPTKSSYPAEVPGPRGAPVAHRTVASLASRHHGCIESA
jgi:hypothetical protein